MKIFFLNNDGGGSGAIPRIQTLKAELPPFDGVGGPHFPRRAAGREPALFRRRQTAKLRLARVVLLEEILLRPQTIEDRNFHAGQHRPLGTEQVENHDVIGARAEPRRGQIHRLRRTNIPIFAEAVAVDPEKSEAPIGDVQERIAGSG